MTENVTNIEALLDAKQVAKYLHCSLPLIYKMADQGRIPCIRWDCPGKGEQKPRTMVRFKQGDVLSFIEKHYQRT